MCKKFLLPIYAGFILFSILTLFNGVVGFNNSEKLEISKNIIENHVKSLNNKSVRLQDEINLLSENPDRIKTAIRPLGLIGKGEKVVKVINYNVTNKLYSIDKRLSIPNFKQTNNTNILVSVILTVILSVGILMVGVLRDTFEEK